MFGISGLLHIDEKTWYSGYKWINTKHKIVQWEKYMYTYLSNNFAYNVFILQIQIT